MLAPRLRFKGFNGSWENPKLGERMEIFRGASPRPQGDPRYYGGSVPRLMIQDVTRDGKYAFPKIDFLTEEGAKKSRFLKKGSIVLSCSGTRVAIPGILGVDACIHDGWLAFKNFKEVDTDFLFNLFVKLHERMQGSATTGGVFNNLTTSIVRDLKMGFPTLPEQQKIAAFLSAVDEKIQQLSRKKELLEQYKKGIMQELFAGNLRFKDENGNTFPKWQEKMLGEVGDTFNGLTGKTKENFGEGKPYIQYMQIFSNSKIDITKCGLVQIDDNENQPRVQYGDVFFTTSSETPNEIGTCSVLLDETEEMYLNSFCFGFRPNSLAQLIPNFASYLFRNEIFRKKIIKLAQGSTRYNMSKVQLLKLRISLPSSAEQKIIANYLSSIDNKIEILNKQIAQTQNFKKGLLQQMFV